jgi:hypothetical protein
MCKNHATLTVSVVSPFLEDIIFHSKDKGLFQEGGKNNLQEVAILNQENGMLMIG